ncbi:hypothetical protein SAMN05216410_0380 [Sanguibacter gelidistatuariae]|uniref:Magnesium transporter NIPA n=1 Tax=Sanguibacter gelidistatuariae TaxID=1814289 RepID=A0A1G6GR24_9MICO|nr:hypothetical protein [Sanguibacter gelidistatuariae]SDB84293.1 hypothetical protein SAMN05216410_0380 [Sanguibacter gelidistatuariae]
MSLSIFAALAAAAGYGGGSVVQAMASTQAAGLKVFRRPAYAVGTSITLVAWAFSLVALKYLPLLTVQTVLASALVVTVLLDRAVFGTRLRRIDVLAALAVTGALALLAVGSGAQSRVATPSWFGFSMLVLLAALIVATAVTYRRADASVQAVLSGLASAGLAMCARAAHGSGGWIDFFLTPMAWLTIGFAILSSVTFSRAVEHGTVGPARALVSVTQVIIPGLVGVTILGDTVRDGWGATTLVAVLIALVGCIILATRPAGATPHLADVRAHAAGTLDFDPTISEVEALRTTPADIVALDLAAIERFPAPRVHLAGRGRTR